MYIIYEVVDRYITRDIAQKDLGYVETEEDAKQVCARLNESVKDKNKANTMGHWHYTYKKIEKIQEV